MKAKVPTDRQPNVAVRIEYWCNVVLIPFIIACTLHRHSIAIASLVHSFYLSFFISIFVAHIRSYVVQSSSVVVGLIVDVVVSLWYLLLDWIYSVDVAHGWFCSSLLFSSLLYFFYSFLCALSSHCARYVVLQMLHFYVNINIPLSIRLSYLVCLYMVGIALNVWMRASTFSECKESIRRKHIVNVT